MNTSPRSRLSGSSLAEHYAALLAEQGSSGLSVSQFAASRGLSAPTLYQWRRRLAGGDREPDPSGSHLVAVDVIGPVSGAGSASSRYEIVLVNGLTLRLPCDFAASRVAELVTSLSSC